METTTTSTNHEWRDWLLGEVTVVLAQVVSVTAALWVRHLVMRAIDSKLLDKRIVEHGLTTPQATVPATVPVNAPRPTLFEQYAPQGRVFREASGLVWIREWGRNIRYRNKYNLDELELYDHDETLNRGHSEGPCPLLKVRTDCWECEWYNTRPHDERETKCAARFWLEEVKNPHVDLNAVMHDM